MPPVSLQRALSAFTLVVFGFLALAPTNADARMTVYRNPHYDVAVTYNVTYAQGLRCLSAAAAARHVAAATDAASSYSDRSEPTDECTPMNLLLDIYSPQEKSARDGTASVFPVILLAHGGGNSGGDKNQACFQGTAAYFAARGFIAVNIDYRLAGDHGVFPPMPPVANSASRSSVSSDSSASDASSGPNATVAVADWEPQWPSAYPAVRDTKAAVRFLRSAAAQLGINTSAIAVSGGSAGATNVLTAGIVFESDYKDELTAAQDPTLLSTHLNESSRVHAVYTHWASDGEIALIESFDPQHRVRYSPANAPVIEFHGNKDTTIPIAHAYAVQAAYNKTGVPYALHVLDGCGHGAWCAGCDGQCGCRNGTAGYCPQMDAVALPFLANVLDLNLVENYSYA